MLVNISPFHCFSRAAWEEAFLGNWIRKHWLDYWKSEYFERLEIPLESLESFSSLVNSEEEIYLGDICALTLQLRRRRMPFGMIPDQTLCAIQVLSEWYKKHFIPFTLATMNQGSSRISYPHTRIVAGLYAALIKDGWAHTDARPTFWVLTTSRWWGLKKAKSSQKRFSFSHDTACRFMVCYMLC